MLIPRKPVCGAAKSLSGCSFRLEGRWAAPADVSNVWNVVLTACDCVDAVSLVVVVVATSFVVVGSVMKKR